MADLFLVAGLGNPGDRYTGTRHNVGFEVVDRLAEQLSGEGRGSVRVDRLDCRALTARVALEGASVLLAKPQTYMNLSGESVKGLATKHEVALERLLVVVDDVALPVGRIRLRPSGSSGGQKGLQNVVDCFGTNTIPRLRVGIAGAHYREGEDKSDYVLERFGKAERESAKESVEDACDAVRVFVREGIDAAMSRFNGASETSPVA